MNSDEVQSVLYLSSACADEARTPQLRAAGQTTGVGPGIADVLGVRQRVQEARAPCWSSASALLRPLADLGEPVRHAQHATGLLTRSASLGHISTYMGTRRLQRFAVLAGKLATPREPEEIHRTDPDFRSS